MDHKAKKYLFFSLLQKKCADSWSRVTVTKPNPACYLFPNDANEVGKCPNPERSCQTKTITIANYSFFLLKPVCLLIRLFSFAFSCSDFPSSHPDASISSKGWSGLSQQEHKEKEIVNILLLTFKIGFLSKTIFLIVRFCWEWAFSKFFLSPLWIIIIEFHKKHVLIKQEERVDKATFSEFRIYGKKESRGRESTYPNKCLDLSSLSQNHG